ncbi:MAG: hypothetical protein RB191_02160 [Terriglobia bacterium]|nr:hypothetical protein [Terriglobia bacterium]
MTYAEFYHNSTGYIPGTIPPRYDAAHVALIPACGSDSVAILDGRWSVRHGADIARGICRKRGFLGFAIHRGESFTRSHEVRALERVTL